MSETKQFDAIIRGIARTERYDEITLAMNLGALNELLEGIGGIEAMRKTNLYTFDMWTGLDHYGRPSVTFKMKMKDE